MARSYLEREDIQSMLLVRAWQVWKRCEGWDVDEARRYTKQAIWFAASDIRATIRRQARAPVQVDPPVEDVPEPAGADTVSQYEAVDTLRAVMDALEPHEWRILATAALWRSQFPPAGERHGLSKGMWYHHVRNSRKKISALV